MENKTKTKKEFFEPQIITAKYDLDANLYRTLLLVTETDIHNLKTVKKQLVFECKHPTEMHDVCRGQKYCMACNMDL